MNPFTHNITRLFDFNGRQNRQPYWLWVLICYGFQTVLSIIVMIPLMVSMFSGMEPLMRADPEYINGHPEAAQAMVMQAMAPVMGAFVWFSAAMSLLFVALLLAATVRRLHDGNRSGWWSAPVFAFQVVTPLIYGLYFPTMFAKLGNFRPGADGDVQAAMAPMMQTMNAISVFGMVGTLMMLLLVILLVLEGTRGPNRFGPDPLGAHDFPEFK